MAPQRAETGSIRDRRPKLEHRCSVAALMTRQVSAFTRTGHGRGPLIGAFCTTVRRVIRPVNRGILSENKFGGTKRNKNGLETMCLISKWIQIQRITWDLS